MDDAPSDHDAWGDDAQVNVAQEPDIVSAHERRNNRMARKGATPMKSPARGRADLSSDQLEALITKGMWRESEGEGKKRGCKVDANLNNSKIA